MRNLKWIMLPFTVYIFLQFVERATDSYGITCEDDVYMYWGWILLLANTSLFIWDKKWQSLISKFNSKSE